VRRLVLVMCGCNSILGLGNVQDRHVDAQQFDAPPRMPRCPAPNTVAPQFGYEFHQIADIPMNCRQYSVAMDGTRMALCIPSADLPGNWRLFAAEPNGAFAAVPLAPPFDGIVDDARLAPDGLLAVVRAQDQLMSKLHTFLLHHTGPGSWTFADTYPGTSSSINFIVAPSGGPTYHLLWTDFDLQMRQILFEYVGDGDTWTLQDSYPLADVLGSGQFSTAPALSPDGLQFTTVAMFTSTAAAYADRATPTERFSPLRTIDQLPAQIGDPVLTANCDRLYFDIFERVFYVEQP
jgi:hypothetical protein